LEPYQLPLFLNLEFDHLLLFLNFDYELQLWCFQQSDFHGVAQNQTFIIVGPSFFPNPLLFLVILVYFIEQQTSPNSPLF